MSTKINPAFYAVVPAPVRYDENLSSTGKLLYGEIAALCNTEGFCWANNNYFAKLYGITKKRVSELINLLEERGHIYTEINKEGGNSRNIWVDHPILKNKYRYPEKGVDPIRKNTEHNNKTNNKNNIDVASSPASPVSQHVQAVYRLYLKCFKLEKGAELILTNAELLANAEKRYKLTPKRRAAIERRLEDAGYNMLCAAIVGYSREEWYQGENDRGWSADLEQFICRSYEKVEEGANKYERQKQSKNTNDPWANL